MNTPATPAAALPASPSAEIFRLAFHNSPAMQSIVRFRDGVLIDVNAAFLQRLGFSREEVIGRTPLEIGFWVNPEHMVAYRERLGREGCVRDYEAMVRGKDGKVRTVLLSSDMVESGGERYALTAGMDLTERKAAEERARESEARFVTAFAASPVYMTIGALPDGRFVEVNDAFLRGTGLARAEVIGRTSRELALWADEDARAALFARVARDGSVSNFECRIRSSDGRVRTMLLSAESVAINGEPHLLTFGVDVTEQKGAEVALRTAHEQLRQSEELFSQAFHANPSTVALTRYDDGRFVSVNEAFVRQSGYSEAETIGRTGRDLNLHAAPGQREEYFRQINEQGCARNVELIVRSKDGRLRTVLASGEKCEIDGVPHVLTVGVDITARKEAEEQLRASEQRQRETEARVRALYESISTTVLVLDAGRVVQLNSYALHILGAARAEEILGRKLTDFSPTRQPDGTESAAGLARHFAQTAGGRVHRFEWVGRRIGGKEFAMEVTLTPLQLGGQDLLQAVIIDLSDFKRTEAELQNALRQERELNQLKTDFVSVVSHEFRTPLEIIMSSVDNLDRYHDRLPGEKRTELLRTIHKSVRRMAGMMEEVLVLGRFDSGGTQFKPAPLNLPALAQRVCDEMVSATGRTSPIELEIAGELAGADGDEAILRHILTNLLSNAVKYSAPGKPVGLAVQREGRFAILRVRDEGCGIPEADRKRLFQAFFRGGNVRQIPGTGLGLLIVRRSVELHGGEIAFESAEGRGTTFTVRLPLFPGAA
ncbi:MAG TPA: PAS domain S-box protein [Opitutus sp.]|nr:PAS domain S-box protein [Opitutus sp.]